jgi:acyl-coenzyme A thioesterase PaaI-like protein
MSNPDYLLLHESTAAGAPARALRTRPILEDLAAELVSFDCGSGKIEMAFTPAQRHLQGHGVVAGGVVGSMLDIAMSLPVLGVLEAETLFATASFNVNLMAAVEPGRVLVSGWIERLSTKVAFCAARMTSADGKRSILATGASTIVIKRVEGNG